MPGWSALPGPDMDHNVGLHDTATAVEWTHKYIARFGGDLKQITFMGESAGGALINLMLTGNGGKGYLHFQQVYYALQLQSSYRNSAGIYIIACDTSSS